MESSIELIGRYKKQPQLASYADQFEKSRLARLYVGDHRSDAHLTKTYDKVAKRWLAGIYTVELSLDSRQLIATKRIAAPQLLGQVFAYQDKNHPFFVWGVDAWLSAAQHIAALNTVEGVA
jgi:hypothetical protein